MSGKRNWKRYLEAYGGWRYPVKVTDIMRLRTDHSSKWKTGGEASAYWAHGWPYLDRSAVDYLASKPMRAIGVESLDPDWGESALMSRPAIAHR